MKKVLLVLALALIGQFAIAQNLQVQTALSKQKEAQQYIDAAEKFKAANKMDKAAKQMSNAKILMSDAKKSIDIASTNEATINQAKTWHYYSVIYYKIGAYPEFNDLDPNSYDKVLDAIDKIQQLDPNYFNQMGPELASYVKGIGGTYCQLGIESFNNENYEQAMADFQKSVDALAKVGIVDAEIMNNLAICARKLDKHDVAATTYETLISKGFEEPGYYAHLIDAYKELGQYDKAVETIAIAREKYPEDPQIVNEMISTYITMKRESEIIDQIEMMAQKYTEKPEYYFILGTIYGNKESELYNVDKALEYYDKSIQVDENYVNAYSNAGSLLIEKASEIYQEANDKDPGQYKNFNEYLKATNDMAEEAKVFDQRAMTYVEKTYQLQPDDPYVKQALKGIYTRLKMMDKAKELDQ